MPSAYHLVVGLAAAAAALGATHASAQPTPSPPGPAPGREVGWTVASGYSTTSFRDIARTGPPVDASPIALAGDGFAILLRNDRATMVRLHRFELEFLGSGSFAFESPVDSIARPTDGRLTRLGGRYEYRRYLLRDLAIDGLDIGLGVQGAGERVSLTREVPTAISIDRATLQAGPGVVAAARLHRWRRFDVEAVWVNSILFGRTTTKHSAEVVSSSASYGGGWVTDLRLTTNVRVGSVVWLVAAYGRSDGGVVSSHLGVTSSERQILVGVKYGR
jgi:hypothetical protein